MTHPTVTQALTGDKVAEAIRPTLDRFVLASQPMLRDCAEAVYEQLLHSVQDYLRDNAEWNIGSEIDRCRKIEAENRELRADIETRTATEASTAARIAALEGALETAANALDWAARRMSSPAYAEVVANDCRQARAALAATEGEAMDERGNLPADWEQRRAAIEARFAREGRDG